MQKKVKDFNENKLYHIEPMPAHARILDIESEIGELAKEYLKSSSYGTKIFEATEDFKEEFGDVVYSILSLADELNISSEECLDMVLEKLKKRIKKNKSMGSGR